MTPNAPIGAGTAGQSPRRRGPGLDAALVGVATAVLVHGAVLAGVEVLDLAAPGMGGGSPTAAAAIADGERVGALDPSCDGDAMLRAAARATLCTTPFVDDAAACLEDVEARMKTDFVLCHIDSLEQLPEIALVDLPQVEKLAAIDPEPLLEPLTPEEVEKFQQKLAQQEPPPPPPPAPAAAPPPPPRPPMQAQVIETAKPENEEDPEHARFLAEFSSKADEQKVARGSKHEDITKKPEAAELTAKKDPKPANLPEPPEEEIGKQPDAPPLPGALSMRAPGTPNPGEVQQDKRVAGDLAGKDGPEGDGSIAKKGDGSLSSQEAREPTETARGQGGAGGGSPRAPNLRPDDEVLERVIGGGSVDHVADVDEGDENQFNAKRWVYASFFNRMKRQVAQNWDPASVWRREDPEGKHYGYKSRVTQLRVSLDATGKVAKIAVLTPSGVQVLDDEAIRAFKVSGPFPNPPAALVDRDGLITFEFGFHFSIDQRKTSWRVQRSM